jgi:hypothetical protein
VCGAQLYTYIRGAQIKVAAKFPIYIIYSFRTVYRHHCICNARHRSAPKPNAHINMGISSGLAQGPIQRLYPNLRGICVVDESSPGNNIISFPVLFRSAFVLQQRNWRTVGVPCCLLLPNCSAATSDSRALPVTVCLCHIVFRLYMCRPLVQLSAQLSSCLVATCL